MHSPRHRRLDGASTPGTSAGAPRRCAAWLVTIAALLLLTPACASDQAVVGARASAAGESPAGDTPPPPTAATTPLGHPGDAYTLVWGDEFDGDELDPGLWSPRGHGRQPGRVGLVSPLATRLTGDGYLILESSLVDGDLLTAMIGTQETFTAAHGWYEARIRFQERPGHHGAFWLQAQSALVPDGGPKGSEVDIVEYFGDRGTDRDLMQAVYPAGMPNTGTFTDEEGARFFPLTEPFLPPGATPASDFHTYAVEWTSSGYRFFIDGSLTSETTAGRSDVPAYIVLSLVSSEWENPRLDVALLPDAMTVDYVRVFAPAATARRAGA